MSLRFATLGILEAKPMTGYELGQRFATSALWVWSAPLSQIYPLLAKLESEGLVSGDAEVVGGRAQRKYSLTALGREHLVQWISSPHEVPPVRDPLLLQTLFFDLADPLIAAELLHAAIESEREHIDEWTAHRDLLAAGETPVIQARLLDRDAKDHARIKRIKAAAFDGLVELGKARLRWLENMLETVCA